MSYTSIEYGLVLTGEPFFVNQDMPDVKGFDDLIIECNPLDINMLFISFGEINDRIIRLPEMPSMWILLSWLRDFGWTAEWCIFRTER